ncbi:MAG TPA: HAMP domain-containing sensor histidine kinase [Candidatus Eisenbacteria bacterium]|nr:HAMP domain-containing sensor histidine kinase [Candidatus Eisenbacteria bacterium]
MPVSGDLVSCRSMTLRQQQAAVFLGTVIFIFGLFAAGLWLIAQRLTREATLQTALVMARQVEIALADSLRQRPDSNPRRPASAQPQSFWSFLGNIFPGRPQSRPPSNPNVSRHSEVKGLMRAFIDRSGSIEAMWVLNADGKVLYSSMGHKPGESLGDEKMYENLKQGLTTIHSRARGKSVTYDVLVPLQMPAGVEGPGGLRLWINPADWSELLAGLWRQLTLLFVLGGSVALLSALLTTALYTRRFRLITETLRQADQGTYRARPSYSSRDEVSASLDLIDRLVMKQRKGARAPDPNQRLAVAARTLAHEVRTPLNALAIHLEVLRSTNGSPDDGRKERSLAALENSIRQVDRLVRDFTEYTAPVGMRREPLDLSQVLEASLHDLESSCKPRHIALQKALPPGPWPVYGDPARLRQAFDNLFRNAIEAQPHGGEIRVSGERTGAELVLCVADRGPGISPEQRSSLFEFGHTTKPGGSGIGLPLTQLILEAHGGSVTYEDRNGAGAAFRVTLPLEES